MLLGNQNFLVQLMWLDADRLDFLGMLVNSTSKANARKVFVIDNSFILPQVRLLMHTKQNSESKIP